MDIKEMLDKFDLIQDKVNSEYFTDNEKISFINSAQIDFVSNLITELFYSSNKQAGLTSKVGTTTEKTDSSKDILRPLTLEDMLISSDASGIISISSINSSINSITLNGENFIHIENVSLGNSVNSSIPVKFVRHNDFNKFKTNAFKRFSSLEPQYTINRNGIQVKPGGILEYLITVIKEPISVNYDSINTENNVDCELPSYCHDLVVELAIKKASVSSRDSTLMQMNNLNNLNIKDMA